MRNSALVLKPRFPLHLLRFEVSISLQIYNTESLLVGHQSSLKEVTRNRTLLSRFRRELLAKRN